MALTVLQPEWGAQRPIFGFLFDMDGVILDSEKLYTRFWQEAARSLGYPMTLEQALGMRSLNREIGAEKLRSYFGPGVDYSQVRNRRIALMDAYVAENGIEPKPGITELLDALDAAGIPAAITTSSPMERVEQYLKPLGLYHRFRCICTGYQVARGKPEPDIYLYGAESIGVPPENCIALEDSAAGILSAFRAGCLSVMVPDQDRPTEETLGRLYAIADSLSDVTALI